MTRLTLTDASDVLKVEVIKTKVDGVPAEVWSEAQ